MRVWEAELEVSDRVMDVDDTPVILPRMRRRPLEPLCACVPWCFALPVFAGKLAQLVVYVSTVIERTTGTREPRGVCSIATTHDPTVSEDGEITVVCVNLVPDVHPTVVSPVAVPCTCKLEADGDTAAMVPLAAIFGGCLVAVEADLGGAVELVLEAADPQAASITPLTSTLTIPITRRFKPFSFLVSLLRP